MAQHGTERISRHGLTLPVTPEKLVTQEKLSCQSSLDIHKDLKDRLQFAYQKANEEARRAGEKYKKYYDENVRHAVLEVGDRVLVRNVGLKGRQKLADKWGKHIFIVKSQPVSDVPVYEVRKENSNSAPKLLHRNMLLPFIGLPSPEEEDVPKQERRQRPVAKKSDENPDDEDDSCSTSSSDDSDDSEVEIDLPPPKVNLPTRGQGDRQHKPQVNIPKGKGKTPQSVRRGTRVRRLPNWMQAGDWAVNCNEHIFYVNPEDVVYI